MTDQFVEDAQIPTTVEFVREDTYGTTPTDPDYTLFADDVISHGMTHAYNVEEQRTAGSAYATDHKPGAEGHSASFEYFMQQWLVDGSGDAQDAAYDGLFRENGQLPNTHTILSRTERSSGGNDSGGIYTIRVMKGAKIDTASLEWVQDTGLPIPVTLDYQVREGKRYDVHQPSSSTTLTVKSTDSSDTTQTVTVENLDAGTSESFDLNGTTLVTSSTAFSEVGQVNVDGETVGDVVVSVNDGNQSTPTEGATIITINGTSSLPQGYVGERGIPLIGSGSHGSSLGDSNEEIFLGDNIERPSGTAIADNWSSGTLEVSNDLAAIPDGNQDQFQSWQEGNATPEVSIELFGETVPQSIINDLKKAVQDDIVWTASGGSVTLKNAQVKSDIDDAISAGDQRVTVEPAFGGTDLTVS